MNGHTAQTINGSQRTAGAKHLYSLVSGEVVEYPDQPAAVNAFLARVTATVNDPAVSPAELLSLVYGTENPILDTTTQPGRAIVTKAVFENPVYRVLADLVGRKQLLAAGQTPEQAAAAYTVSVKDAAAQLGLTESSVRTAINNRKLSAVKRNGDWYIRPESIASYKVSNRGRKKAMSDSSAADPTETSAQPNGDAAEHGVTVICGSVPGGSLAVRIANAELVVTGKDGHKVLGSFPPGWTKAAVKTTTSNGVRLFELEPAAAMDAELPHEVKHLGFMVAGEFKVVKKHNATKVAVEVWKKYAGNSPTENIMQTFTCHFGPIQETALTEKGAFAIQDTLGRTWYCYEGGTGHHFYPLAELATLEAASKLGNSEPHRMLTLTCDRAQLPAKLGQEQI